MQHRLIVRIHHGGFIDLQLVLLALLLITERDLMRHLQRVGPDEHDAPCLVPLHPPQQVAVRADRHNDDEGVLRRRRHERVCPVADRGADALARRIGRIVCERIQGAVPPKSVLGSATVKVGALTVKLDYRAKSQTRSIKRRGILNKE